VVIEYRVFKISKKTLSIVKIGEKYGVSDNAVRKWIKTYERKTSLNTYPLTKIERNATHPSI
jgi:transposase-like protein